MPFTVTTAEKIETIVESAADRRNPVGKFGSYCLLVKDHIAVTLDSGERFNVWSDAHGLFNVYNVKTRFTGCDADLLTACQMAVKP